MLRAPLAAALLSALSALPAAAQTPQPLVDLNTKGTALSG
jgi:hypothetical protein